MAKYCAYCGKEIDDKPYCPYCGHQNEQIQNNSITQTQPNIDTRKSKLAAGLMAILIGEFGAHNFYLGYNGKAIAQLLITLLSCFTLSFVSGIWALIEGIMILTDSINVDAKGNTLKD